MSAFVPGMDRGEVLGLDFGRVITAESTDGAPTIFSDEYQGTLPRPDAIPTIQDLAANRYSDRIHIVSKCKPRVQRRTLELLELWDFYEKTGINPDNVHFCRESAEKAAIAEELGVTQFVDDRFKVLRRMSESIGRILFIPPEEIKETKQLELPPGIIAVEGWPGVRAVLLAG